MSKFTLKMVPGWEREVLSDPQAQAIVEYHTARLAELAIKSAPKASHRSNWNSIKRNITAMVTLYDTWYGQVVIEAEHDVRHAMLQELGWRDRKGHRHPGRFYLKEALERARIE
ncbi:hypothetical protein ACIQC7_08975 [Kitasatospora sp. NPDC088556]|uniref:hypothetical protein n=1 Tax=Kitasatospora sp. NPDC088556 TaxID=3364076 RepID=UPI00382C438D